MTEKHPISMQAGFLNWIPQLKAKQRARRKPSAANAMACASEPSCQQRCDERSPRPLWTEC